MKKVVILESLGIPAEELKAFQTEPHPIVNRLL